MHVDLSGAMLLIYYCLFMFNLNSFIYLCLFRRIRTGLSWIHGVLRVLLLFFLFLLLLVYYGHSVTLPWHLSACPTWEQYRSRRRPTRGAETRPVRKGWPVRRREIPPWSKRPGVSKDVCILLFIASLATY